MGVKNISSTRRYISRIKEFSDILKDQNLSDEERKIYENKYSTEVNALARISPDNPFLKEIGYEPPASDTGDTVPVGGTFPVPVPEVDKDTRTIQEKDEEQARESLDEILSKREIGRNELADILSQEQNRQFGLELPNIAEEALAGGILRSSGFGEAMARKATELEGARQTQMMLAGLSDVDLESSALGNILGRTFSTQDWEREAALAKELGSQITPNMDEDGGFSLMGAISGASAGAGIASLLPAAAGTMNPYTLPIVLGLGAAGGIGGGK
jgi:hypothetical protein